MALFYSSGAANSVGVSDIAAATAWYIEKLGLRRIKVALDNGEDCIALGFDKDDCAFCLGPRSGSARRTQPQTLLLQRQESSRVSRLSRSKCR